jgi:hypothetical protein
MSIERNPNINAAGLAAEVASAIHKYARGKAVGKALQPEEMRELIIEFCTTVSLLLDREFGE